jgi:hypothetical protein
MQTDGTAKIVYIRQNIGMDFFYDHGIFSYFFFFFFSSNLRIKLMAYSGFYEFHLPHSLPGFPLSLGLYQRACFGNRRSSLAQILLHS